MRVSSITGMAGSILGIFLSYLLIQKPDPGYHQEIILSLFLLMPSIAALLSAILTKFVALLISLIWILPMALYLSFFSEGILQYTFIIILLLSSSLVLIKRKKRIKNS